MATMSYQKLSNELDEIMGRLQAVDTDVDEAMKLYDRGTAVLQQLQTYLKTAENKVKKLKTLKA